MIFYIFLLANRVIRFASTKSGARAILECKKVSGQLINKFKK
jgi:hypothetical protein